MSRAGMQVVNAGMDGHLASDGVEMRDQAHLRAAVAPQFLRRTTRLTPAKTLRPLHLRNHPPTCRCLSFYALFSASLAPPAMSAVHVAED